MQTLYKNFDLWGKNGKNFGLKFDGKLAWNDGFIYNNRQYDKADLTGTIWGA